MSATDVKMHKCNCCGDPIPFVNFTELRRDPELGTVCEECHYRLRVAVAWLKYFSFKHCVDQPKGSMGDEGRALA